MLALTESARNAIKTAIEDAAAPVAGLRILVQTGGCAGLRYGMALEHGPAEDDTTLELDGLTVLVDPVSRPLLEGVTVDFVCNVDASGFVFDNPNASERCDCGKSFC
ncbi:MAG: iron-sulfur cluster assembly accessory protein [Pseudomonadota bacterium]